LGNAAIQTLDEIHHLVDILGGARIVVSVADAESVEVLEESADPGSRLLVEPVPVLAGILDETVIDVGEVHDMGDPIESALQPPSQHVLEQECSEVTDMGPVPHRGSAGVDADVSRLKRFDRLQPPAQGVVESHRHGS